MDVISEAGGLSANAGGLAYIHRGSVGTAAVNGGRAVDRRPEKVDLRRLEAGDASANVPIFPGDTVTIPPGGVVYVVGAVNKPGGFVLSTDHQGLTVMQALALAEGLKPTARRNKAMIVRRGQQPGQRSEIPVKLAEVLAAKAPDPVLQANDVVFVPDSSARKAFGRGAEAAVQLATGVIIWR